MRNVNTREGYEFWDKICAVQSYAFLLSPDGRRVVKTPDIGDWIDKHEAQVIVDHAQEEFNVMKAERDTLQLLLNERDEQVHSLEQRRQAEQQACQAAARRVEELEQLLVGGVVVSREWLNAVALMQMSHEELQEQAVEYLCEPCDDAATSTSTGLEKDDDWRMNPCQQGHHDVGAAGGVAACNQCDEKIEAPTTEEAFERWNATHPQQ